jgi:hypothetical protein
MTTGHWTDDQLLQTIYGIGPSDNHLDECADCNSRLVAMQANREGVERAASFDVGLDMLAAQRRAIYKRLDAPVQWWNSLAVRRWAAGFTTAGVLAGSLFIYEQNQQVKKVQQQISDAQLAQQVAAMASDSDLQTMAPLEGLFE